MPTTNEILNLYESNDGFQSLYECEVQGKTMYTEARDPEEAATKFHRYMACQWVGYPWDGPESFLAGVLDAIKNGVRI